ncbi:MAG TPA: transglutaminase-like domain-containing protein [Bacteroidia bacterium]|nr:transglutaminase-like domain-containing protein [Bacteroidia bacterium]
MPFFVSRIYLFLLSGLFLSAVVFCQNESNPFSLQFNAKELNIAKEKERDPHLLVAELIKGRTSDKEKFDAIFAWVALHIRYDFRQYFSSAGSFSRSAKSILHSRSAVCLGYANLMDTLCGIAGITNTTVYGYVKDNLFDVGDSIYLDNHAWNAVKLDGLWYLYDVTWSTGTKEYLFKPFSRFILKLKKKFPKKFRKRKLRSKLARRFDDYCKQESTVPVYYYKQKKFNKFIRWLLSRFKIKMQQKYIYKINTNYYLCQPEVFAIDHFPDHSIWSLRNAKGMHHFKNDSAYYYLTDSIYKNQERVGRECPECDDFLELGRKQKVKEFEAQSSQQNPKNQFVIAENEFSLASINIKEAYAEPADSIKLLFIDSTDACLKKIKSSLKNSRRNVAVEGKQQRRKNKRKMQLLLNENKGHRKFIRKRVSETIFEIRTYMELENKCISNGHAFGRRAERVGHVSTDFKTYPPKKIPRKLAQTLVRMKKTQKQLDSLYAHITYKKSEFDTLMAHLSMYVWQQGFGLDSLSNRFGNCILLRRKLYDNYKKGIVDQRKKINLFEKEYGQSLEELVYRPARKGAAIFNSVCQLIKQKQKLQQKYLSYQRYLVSIENDPMSDLKDYKDFMLDDIKSDYCWLENAAPLVQSSYLGFSFLHDQQDDITLQIINENASERIRYYLVDEEIKRRYRKHNSIIDANRRLLRLVSRALKKYKLKIRKKRA